MHYNNGILNGTNQAVKMALDSIGNVYVTGFSQNTNGNLDYVTIKYSPNANQVWTARYDSSNTAMAMPAGIVLDTSNNVIVTGSALTVKYDTNGTQAWTAPYAGTSLAVDTNLNVYVVGFSTDFGTVKLSPAGSNLWQAAYPSTLGPNVSQAVAVHSNGNVDVAGSQTYVCDAHSCYHQMLLVQYDFNGNQLWTAANLYGGVPPIQVEGIALDNAANIFLLANSYFTPYATFKYESSGGEVWAGSNLTYNVESIGGGIVLDSANNVFVTGQKHDDIDNNSTYGTYKMDTDGICVWTNSYPQNPIAPSVATSLALDHVKNVYVTGYSPGTNSINDIVTIKYGASGNQIWLQRYGSPGNAAGNAIAVDNNGNVYVTGYDTTTAGGTEIVTIKYSPVTLQRRSDGTVILQAQGAPGESFDIEASEDLFHWLDLGSVLADTNGLMQFDDTNAPAYPARFYSTTPQ